MSDSLALGLVLVFTVILPEALGAYGAYWAFSIRRALVGRVYRNHALWLGVVCVVFRLALTVANISTNSTLISLALNLVIAGLLVVVFAFIDSVVAVARRSDPLLRSILRWEKLRIALWFDVVLATIYLIISSVDPAATNSGVGGAVGFPLILLPFIIGAPAVLVGARRSMDPVLQGSLRWFGAFLLFFLVTALVSFVELVVLGISAYDSTYSYPALAFAPPSILAGYALYRSARSLSPMSRLPAVESKAASHPIQA